MGIFFQLTKYRRCVLEMFVKNAIQNVTVRQNAELLIYYFTASKLPSFLH